MDKRHLNSQISTIFSLSDKVLLDNWCRLLPFGYCVDGTKYWVATDRFDLTADDIALMVIKAILSARDRLSGKMLAHTHTLDVYNAEKPDRFHLTNIGLGRITSRLGFNPANNGGNRGIEWDESLVERLCVKYGVPYTSSQDEETLFV